MLGTATLLLPVLLGTLAAKTTQASAKPTPLLVERGLNVEGVGKAQWTQTQNFRIQRKAKYLSFG